MWYTMSMRIQRLTAYILIAALAAGVPVMLALRGAAAPALETLRGAGYRYRPAP